MGNDGCSGVLVRDAPQHNRDLVDDYGVSIVCHDDVDEASQAVSSYLRVRLTDASHETHPGRREARSQMLYQLVKQRWRQPKGPLE